MLVLLATLAHATPAMNPLQLSHDALWGAYLHHFEPQAAPADALPPLCATVLVETLKQRWSEFSEAEQARITSHVAPFLPSLTAPLKPRAAAAGARQPCWGGYLDNERQSDHFSVEWDNGTISSSEVDVLLTELEFSYQVEVADLGWREPDGMNAFLLTVYVINQASAAAYTTVSQCGNVNMPYVVANDGSFFNDVWWKDMVAHEFNHASQFGYGDDLEFWFWEATATYVQESVYPAHNEWAPYITGYSDQPYMAMSASDQADDAIFWHMYGMAIWNFWLDENYGGVATIQDIWSYSDSIGDSYSVTQQEALAGIGVDFAEAFKGFTAANTVMDYAEHAWFPVIRPQIEVEDLPADGSTSSFTEPEAYGSNYIRFDVDPPTWEKTDLLFTFVGDEPANWLVQIVGANDNHVEVVVEVELLESEGVGRLANYGDYDQLYAVASPRKDAPGTFGFSWAAEGAIPIGGTEPEEEETPEDGTGPITVEGESGGGLFGCAATGGTTGLPGLGALLALLALRRRSGG